MRPNTMFRVTGWTSSNRVGSVSGATSYREWTTNHGKPLPPMDSRSSIGETYDHGMLAWKGVAGDFDLVTRLDSLTATAASRAGIMVRGGTGPSRCDRIHRAFLGRGRFIG